MDYSLSQSLVPRWHLRVICVDCVEGIDARQPPRAFFWLSYCHGPLLYQVLGCRTMRQRQYAVRQKTQRTKHTKERIETYATTKNKLHYSGPVPTKSGGTSVYDDSPKEPLLNKLLNITAGFQLFPRSHPRICGISPLILSFNPCAE